MAKVTLVLSVDIVLLRTLMNSTIYISTIGIHDLYLDTIACTLAIGLRHNLLSKYRWELVTGGWSFTSAPLGTSCAHISSKSDECCAIYSIAS